MITLKDIMEKYDIHFNTEDMSSNLKNKILFSDNENDKAVVYDTISLDDIKKPEHETLDGGYESYYYKFGKYELEVIAKPSDKQSFDVTFRYPTPDNVPEPYYVYNWNYKGERGIMI